MGSISRRFIIPNSKRWKTDSGNATFEIVDIDDGQYEFQINAIMSDNYEIRGDILRLDVFFVLPAPSLSSSDYAINLGDEVKLSWDYAEDSIWFL